MTDKELLELAAKAVDIEGMRSVRMRDIDGGVLVLYHYEDETGETLAWNPLTDDGDALRLAVKLRLLVNIDETVSEAVDGKGVDECEIHKYSDDYAATRRAIVRAAAEIARQAGEIGKEG